MGSKAGIVALLGPPNAGKSTLFNRLIGMPLAGVTPKPQTTRFQITGLINCAQGQATLIDTPGLITLPKNAWHRALNRHALRAAQDADVLIYVLSLRERRRSASSETVFFPEGFSVPEKPLLIGITHADELPGPSRQRHIKMVAEWTTPLSPRGIYDVSIGRPLEEFIQAFLSALPQSPPLYPGEEVTPMPLRFFVAEILRQYLYLHLREELPYGIEVEVTGYTESPERDHIRATFYVEKASHKPMVIGKGGTMIKNIGTEARKVIEGLIGKPAYLELYVKVAPHWRKSIQRLKSWGYDVSGQGL